MNIREFYIVSSKLSSSTVQVHAVGLGKEDSNGLFDEHKLILGSYTGITFPVIFKQEYGKKLEDVLDTGWPSLYLISDKMKSTLEHSSLTGWKVFDVSVLDKLNHEIKGYHGLSITGRCGPIDYSKSTIIEKKLAPGAPLSKYYRSLHVDLYKWDGNDFFMPEKYFGITATKRAIEVLKRHKITNIKLKNLEEIELDDYTVKVAMQK